MTSIRLAATSTSLPISSWRLCGASDFTSSGMATSWQESSAVEATFAHDSTHVSSRPFAAKPSRSTRIHEPLGQACREGLVSPTGKLRQVWTCSHRRHILKTCCTTPISATRLNGRGGWPEVPYNDLPLIPPPIELETRPVLKRCVGARAVLDEQGREVVDRRAFILVGHRRFLLVE